MTYQQWRTTELRLLKTDIFSNVGIDIEPAPASSQFNPIILTTKKQNDLANLAFGILKGAPIETSYVDWWDIGQSGITLNSSYRWDYNRKRGEVQLHVPVPVPGILFLDGKSIWRSERWDVTNALRTDAGPANRFQYSSTGFRAELHYIPHYKFDFGGGLEYTNRYANGGIPELLANSSNSAKLLFQGSVRLADGNYRNRIHSEGYFARKGILGDLNYSAVTAELNNEFLFSKESQTVFNWTIRGGTSTGDLPVEDYFVLGVDTHAGNLLRAHPASREGHYGDAPMGTSFALSNMDIERRFAILPLFNTLNLPYLDVKGKIFLDSGQSWDREGVFKEGTLYFDAGAGLKFETRTHSLNLIYARGIHESRNVFFLYIDKRW
jgi:outer membrane protein assembly factor BamA